MPAPSPSLGDLQSAAAAALAHLGTPGQVSVLWERIRGSAGDRETLRATFTAIVDGRVATAAADGLDDGLLARAGKAAVVRAGQMRAAPAPPLPAPTPGRPHEGWDPLALEWTPPDVEGLDVDWQISAARIAIASTSGVRAAEQRSHVRATLRAREGDRTVRVSAAAVGPSGLRLEAAVAEARGLSRADRRMEPMPASGPVVLGPEAVAVLLDHLRPAFGVELDLGGGRLHGRLGRRVATPAVNLSDSARYPGTLPRSYDAEGVPRQPVPLIQDGVAHRRVHDCASAARNGAASTGHASQAATLAPLPEHLVLVGGGAADAAELAARVREGTYVPALSPGREAVGEVFRHATLGAVAIRDGELAGPVADTAVLVDPLEVLASVEALTGFQRLCVLTPHCPGGAGAAVVPALRAGRGVSAA